MPSGAVPNGQLYHHDGNIWEATGNDPQIQLSRHRFAARYAVVELQALDRPLDAAVYLRQDGVFSEEHRVDFPESRHLVIAIDLGEGPAIEGVRIDPAEHPGRFRMRISRPRTRFGLARLLRSRLAETPGLTINLIGPERCLGPRIPSFRLATAGKAGLTETLARIWELAAIEAGREPLPAPDGVELSLLVPVHNADPEWLDTLLESVQTQAAGAELILADDGSTRPETAFWLATHDRIPGLTILRSGTNRGIAHATNRALSVSRGRWVALVDHDDALEPHAVDRIRRALAAHPETLFLYTDEVIADVDMRPVSAFWKPAFDPVLLSGVNYVNHLSVYRRDRLAALGGLRAGFDGSQDYELVLRYTRGLRRDQITHLPYPAYRWRQRAESVSHSSRDLATGRARSALEEHFSTLIGDTCAEPALLPDLHRLRFRRAERPLVSIVIPNRDCFNMIAALLDDLDRRTSYSNFEVVIVDNGSRDPRVPALYDRMAKRMRLIADIREEPFNFAAMVNRGVVQARGDCVLLLNNDVSVIDPNWLEEMVECLAYPGTGIVGARLLYPNDTLQHAGVILGLGGLAGHWYYKADRDDRGEMGRLAVRNGMTAVTGACMLVTRACWDQLGGMDAEQFAVAYNDVDLCARAREQGYGVVWTPFATLYHHESASRGADLVGERARRFQREKTALAERHGTDVYYDPCLSPWYSRFQSRPRLLVRDRLPEPRSFHGFGADLPAATGAHPSGDLQPMPRSARG